MSIEQIEIRDEIWIGNEEIIPADGTLVSGYGLIDYGFVSGESLEEKVDEGDKLYAGGRQKGVPITVKVNKKTSSSYLTELWNQSDMNKSESCKYQLAIDKISLITLFSILITLKKYFFSRGINICPHCTVIYFLL